MNSERHYEAVVEPLKSDKYYPIDSDLLHGVLGLMDEVGELAKVVKAHIFYGKRLSKENLKEECGDKLWFINLICGVLDCTIEELLEINAKKLIARYPEGKFTEERANKRNIPVEIKAMEGKHV